MRVLGRFVREGRARDLLPALAPERAELVEEVGSGFACALVRKGVRDLAWYSEADGSFALVDGELFGASELTRPDGMPGTAAEILRAFRMDGIAALARLNGTAAVTIWDAVSGRLALAADRSGSGLCFWMESGSGITFGSDILSLVRTDPRTELDEAAVDLFLAGGFISSPWTSLAHIRKVPAAHVLIADRKGATLSCYWRASGRPKTRLPKAQLKQLQERALLQAIERQLPGSSTSALLLSSGIDSIYLAAAMARKFGARPITFTYRYADYDGQFNEVERARAASRLLDLEHHEMIVGLADILSNLRSMLIAHSGPFSYGAHSAILRDVTASGAAILYNGLEPDAPYCSPSELVGQWLRAIPLPHAAIAAMIEKAPGARGRWARALTNAERIAASGLVWRFHAPLTPDPIRRSLYLDPDRMERSQRSAALLFSDVVRQYAREDPVVRVAGPLARLYSSEGSNRWAACFGRAHGLLPRSPFLDSDYIELAHRLPWDSKKRIIRELAAELLTPELALSPKIAQTLPITYWLSGPLSDLLSEQLSPARIAGGGHFQPRVVEDLLARHRTGAGAHAWTLWNVLVVTVWQEIVREEAGKDHAIHPSSASLSMPVVESPP